MHMPISAHTRILYTNLWSLAPVIYWQIIYVEWTQAYIRFKRWLTLYAKNINTFNHIFSDVRLVTTDSNSTQSKYFPSLNRNV